MDALGSPRQVARVAGFLYVGAIVAGIAGEMVPPSSPFYRWSIAAGLAGGACYVAITALLYRLFKPVEATISLVAACFSLVGTTMWSLASAGQLAASAFPSAAAAALRIHGEIQLLSLLFFGVYCVLIGSLVYRSTFLPRAVGVLMAFAGACYLFDTLSAVIAPSLNSAVSDYALLAGLIGEVALTLWLVAFGVDEARFRAMQERIG